ncbi:hypothetical protein BV898_09403 [Hypsibius exemplaris]|uniref:Solute carrier family 40 member n=1 Tax=Hypsibius exemplaris TaxID=2072580 RepID=A0A1W0WMK9_HYPEX|nr:hypothetical protein BV898_09403 [Hypsibius exemplaris]
MSNSSPAPAGSYPEGNAENNAENVAKSFSPTRLYPRISVDPPAHPLVNEIKSEDLNEVIRDVNAVPQTNAGTDASTAADLENAAVEDVNQAINELPVEDANQPINKVPIEDVDQAINGVPIEQHVLLLPEPEDMEALSPYRQPSSDTEDNNELALVAPLRKKGKKNKAEGETTELGMSLLENGKTPLNPIIVGIETPKNDVRWWLYLAEIFGRWGDRMWTFTSALFPSALPGSMLLPAIHGFITGLCVIMFGALIGEWVDRTPRLPAVRIALITKIPA